MVEFDPELWVSPEEIVKAGFENASDAKYYIIGRSNPMTTRVKYYVVTSLDYRSDTKPIPTYSHKQFKEKCEREAKPTS